MYKNNYFLKINIIYLLLIIIIFYLLLNFKYEGFIPYFTDSDDIKNYCIKSPSGLFQTHTIINEYQCNNNSPNIIPISNTLKLNTVHIKNNLCPFNTIYVNNNNEPYCIINNQQASYQASQQAPQIQQVSQQAPQIQQTLLHL